jgi:hypothetical protein
MASRRANIHSESSFTVCPLIIFLRRPTVPTYAFGITVPEDFCRVNVVLGDSARYHSTVPRVISAAAWASVGSHTRDFSQAVHLQLSETVCTALLMAISVSTLVRVAFAEQPPALLVVPSHATMLVGEDRRFRAVGPDGHIQHNVRWSVFPADAAELTTNDDEAIVHTVSPSPTIILTADAAGESAKATIEIRAGNSLTPGTAMWSVTSVPGCKPGNLTQAAPSANGPDLYAQESCPDGIYVRALTADGRELRRRRLGDLSLPLPPEVKDRIEPGEHINLDSHALCDAVSADETKETVAKMARNRNLQLDDRQRASNRWLFEEPDSRCVIFFDQRGAVVKKKKTIVTE